jgi:SH3-like domain-containing protein
MTRATLLAAACLLALAAARPAQAASDTTSDATQKTTPRPRHHVAPLHRKTAKKVARHGSTTNHAKRLAHDVHHESHHPTRHLAAASAHAHKAAKLAAVAAVAAAPVVAAAIDKGTDSGLPLPRFAALRSDEVSLRAGPGTRYPIEWIYQRRELPVEIEREFEVWRLVSEPDGTRGWVHEAMLTGRRGFLINADQPQTMRATPADTAAAIAILKTGVVGRLLTCPAANSWCQVEVEGYRGWLPRTAFWGTLPDETVAR